MPEGLPPDFPAPEQGMLLTHMLIVRDIARSRAFYQDILGATLVQEDNPCVLRYSNGWLILNVGGDPTEDKPTVSLAAPADPDTASAALNIRVADMEATYNELSAHGADFLTPPKQWDSEIRCYLRDPDGHLIEMGQTVNQR